METAISTRGLFQNFRFHLSHYTYFFHATQWYSPVDFYYVTSSMAIVSSKEETSQWISLVRIVYQVNQKKFRVRMIIASLNLFTSYFVETEYPTDVKSVLGRLQNLCDRITEDHLRNSCSCSVFRWIITWTSGKKSKSDGKPLLFGLAHERLTLTGHENTRESTNFVESSIKLSLNFDVRIKGVLQTIIQ